MWLLASLGCSAEPRVAILDPRAGDVVCGEPLYVDVLVEGFELVAMDTDAVAGQGHIDLTLNGQDVMMGHEPPFEIFGMDPGEWLLRAELVSSAHLPLDPPAADAIQITIDPSACSGGT